MVEFLSPIIRNLSVGTTVVWFLIAVMPWLRGLRTAPEKAFTAASLLIALWGLADWVFANSSADVAILAVKGPMTCLLLSSLPVLYFGRWLAPPPAGAGPARRLLLRAGPGRPPARRGNSDRAPAAPHGAAEAPRDPRSPDDGDPVSQLRAPDRPDRPLGGQGARRELALGPRAGGGQRPHTRAEIRPRGPPSNAPRGLPHRVRARAARHDGRNPQRSTLRGAPVGDAAGRAGLCGVPGR